MIAPALIGLTTLLLQLQGASLSGRVRDAVDARPLGRAVVTLTDLNRSTVTDESGVYSFLGVPPGPQHVEVRHGGYRARTLHALLPPSDHVTVDLALEPRPIPLSGLRVVAPLAVRGADGPADGTAFPTARLSAAAVRSHPLLAEPDVFTALAGGVAAVQPESPRGLHVRGGSADQVSYEVDGVPVLSPFHSSGLFSAWNPDAIASVRLETTSLGSGVPPTLSGKVIGVTRSPGRTLNAQGALTTTQARLTVDGPLPLAGAGVVLSARRGFPGVLNPEGEQSYVRGGSRDALGKVEAPLAGGRVRFIAHENRDWTGTAVESGVGASSGQGRNRFVWGGRSAGGEWTGGRAGGALVRLRGWAAGAGAAARWRGADGETTALESSRADVGGSAFLLLDDSSGRSTLGARASRSDARYSVGPEGGSRQGLSSGMWSVGLFGEHSRPVGSAVVVQAGAEAALLAGRPHFAPKLEARWSPFPRLSLSGSLSRTHQAEQSLGNAESVVGLVFPPPLYVGAGAAGIAVARGDQALAAVEIEPRPAVRATGQVYVRALRGLALVAPATAEPWAVGRPASGSGSARGAALDLTVSRAHYALVGSYGYSRVRLWSGDSTYTPSFAAVHTLDAGVLYFPHPTLALRLAISAAAGRRATALVGPFEWEACNVLDRGCEFAGSPSARAGPLGAAFLPTYIRVDAGVRKHWHVRFAAKETVIGLSASATNLLNRRNLLTVSVDPSTGSRAGVEMSSLVPLVVGIDWRF